MYIKPYVFTTDEVERMIDLLYYAHTASTPYKKGAKRMFYFMIMCCVLLTCNIIFMLLQKGESLSFWIFINVIYIFFIVITMKPTQHKILKVNLKKILTKQYGPETNFKCDENAIYGRENTVPFSDIVACVSYQHSFYCLITKEQKFIFIPKNIYQDIKQDFLFKHTNIKFAVENKPFDIMSYFPDNR